MAPQEIESRLNAIAAKYVQVTYQSIGLGNGSEEDQESDILDLRYDGRSDTIGRDIRYHFHDRSGHTYFLFADEILEIN